MTSRPCRGRRARSAAAFLAVCLALGAAVAGAQPVRVAGDGLGGRFTDFEQTIDTWSQDLTRIEEARPLITLDPEAAVRDRKAVRAIAIEARAAAKALGQAIEPLRIRFDVLGSRPGDDAPPADGAARTEATDTGRTDTVEPSQTVKQQRAQLSARIAELSNYRRQAEAVAQRAASLVAQLIEAQRASLVDRLKHAGPMPWSAEAVAAAFGEAPRVAERLWRSPQTWWAGLPQSERRDRGQQLRAALILVLGVLGVVVARRWLMRRFGRDPAFAEPGYARRLVAAIIEAGGRGVLPALVLLGLVAVLGSDGVLFTLLSGTFADVIVGLLSALALYMAAHWTLEALLAPQARAWALMSVPGGNDAVFVRRARILAALLAVDIGVTLATRSIFVTEAANAAFAFLMTLAEAAAIWKVADSRIWIVSGDDEDSVDDLDAAQSDARPGLGDGSDDSGFESATWRLVRRAAQLVAIVSVGAQLGGYGNLGRFLIENTMLTFGVVVALVLARGVLRETVGVLSRSRLARKRLGLSARATRRLKVWTRAALDPVLVIAAVFVVLPLWGVPRDTLAAMVGTLTGELELGSVSVSPAAVAAAVFVFFVAMAVIRVLRASFLTPIMTEARVDPGAREAISAGAGYAGVVVALLLAVTVAGFDLTNLAIVAGALSVGIGFGLQGIVNNFLSGLILLVERPFKVGDWIVVGQVEGFVKAINFRATEIETWQLASVTVPNGDVISSAVTNWTHRNTRARIEVRLGVSFEADFERVRAIMLECADAHPRVLKNPEAHVIFLRHDEDRAIFELRVFTGDAIWMLWIASDLRFEVTRRLRESGIEMPLPRRVIQTVPDAAETAKPEG